MAAEVKLPASVQEIADVIGRQDALRLVRQLPRCLVEDKRRPGSMQERVMLYVPKKVKPGHPLVRILGAEGAEKMVRAFGGECLHPANCNAIHKDYRNDAVRKRHREGSRVPVLAASFGVSERQIRNVLRQSANDNAADNGGAQ